jgi:hypothetical protein
MQAELSMKRGRFREVLALLVFVGVTGIWALPCLCVEGEIAGQYKMILWFLVSCRLAWQIYRRTFRFRDYFIYSALVIGFFIWADSRW